MDRKEHMKLAMALIIVLLMFFSATFTMPQLEGNVVESLAEDVVYGEQIANRLEKITEDQSEQSEEQFLSLLLAEQEKRDDILRKINEYEDAPLEAFEIAIQTSREFS